MDLRQGMRWAVPRGRRGSFFSTSPRDHPIETAFSVCRRISGWAVFGEETCRQSSRRLLLSRCSPLSRRSAKRTWTRCTPRWCRATSRWRRWRRSSTFLPYIVTLPRDPCQRLSNPPFFVPSNTRNTSTQRLFTFGSGFASTPPRHRPHGGPSAVESATSIARSLLGWLRISPVRTSVDCCHRPNPPWRHFDSCLQLHSARTACCGRLRKASRRFVSYPSLLSLIFPTASSIESLPFQPTVPRLLPFPRASCQRRTACPASTACP